MTLEISVFDPESGHTTVHRFSRAPVRIGRDAVCELRLPFSFVSGQHALLQFDDDHAELIDPGSTNGVLREGRRLPARQPLPITDNLIVTIGRLELRILRAAADLPESTPTAGETTGTDVASFGRVHALIRELRPLHEQFLRARAEFDAARHAAVEQLPPAARELAAAMLAREFPAAT